MTTRWRCTPTILSPDGRWIYRGPWGERLADAVKGDWRETTWRQDRPSDPWEFVGFDGPLTPPAWAPASRAEQADLDQRQSLPATLSRSEAGLQPHTYKS
ncbi:hypothetical protein BGLA2_610039 [Burkholderia gladioli]|nr:hypothetical protein BGLA2_610039 [Burkholderia gladioli]